MAHWLHIRPWEIGRLTREEFEAAVAWIEREQAAARQDT